MAQVLLFTAKILNILLQTGGELGPSQFLCLVRFESDVETLLSQGLVKM